MEDMAVSTLYEEGRCAEVPEVIHLQGLWNPTSAADFFNYALPRIQIQIALIFLLSQSLYMLLMRYHMPRIVSEILAGLILGPTILGKLIPNFTETLFPRGDFLIKLLSKIGLIFFMFLIGVKMNPALVLKSGKKPWTIGVYSSLILVTLGLSISSVLTRVVSIAKAQAMRTIVATYVLTPFPVIACLLVDLKIINTELGRLAMATTLIRELINTFVSTALNYVRIGMQTSSYLVAVKSLGLNLVFVLVMVLGAREAFLWIIRRTPEGKRVKESYIIFIAFGVLLSAIVSDNVGIDYLFGPFILGLTVPDGPPLGSTLVEKFETFTSGLLTPLLVTHCGLQINLGVVYNLGFWYLLLAVVVIGTAVKFAAILVPSFMCDLPPKDAIALSLVMSTQGIVELATYQINMENETFDAEMFSWMAFAVLLTALVIPLVVRTIYDSSQTYAGYQKRNILHALDGQELHILVCAHKQDDAVAATKLLEVSSSTREAPTVVYGLALMELQGQAAPLLINHKLGQKTSVAGARSQPIIDVFGNYEREYLGFVNIHPYTAISIPKFMHHDICSLAFDRLASLIILPFHRKWNSQGKVFVNNDLIRTINQNVLDMAPCSVAILIDRRKIQNNAIPQLEPTASLARSTANMYRVAVIFLGGEDDREALAYAKRKAKSTMVQLTVVRIMAVEDSGEDNWDMILDTEILKDIKVQGPLKTNVTYREERVRDGPDTASILHSMEDNFDLVMVGRRHRPDSPVLSGLKEWTELPELGVIGDILASPDINKPLSVLVVQQQHMKTTK